MNFEVLTMEPVVAAELRCESCIFEFAWPPLHRRNFSPPLNHFRNYFPFFLHQQPTAAKSTTNRDCPLHHQHQQVENKQWVHFIGIGGAGLSALALYALKQGWHVTGSDIAWSKKLEDLQKAGARVHIGHHESQLWGQDGKRLPDYVVPSAAIPCNNVELAASRKLGIQIHSRGSWLACCTRGYDLIAVSGSHGKSTTTAMLSMVLQDMGNNISAIVGADVPQISTNSFFMCGFSGFGKASCTWDVRFCGKYILG